MNTIFKFIAPFYDKMMKIGGVEDKEKIASEIDPGDRVLDLGGGTGRIAKFIQELQSENETYLLDCNRGMLKKAEEKELKNLVQGYSSNMPFSNDFFDAILCVDALHHFEKTEESLSEMNRVLKPRGKLIVSDFNSESTPMKALEALEILGDRSVSYLSNQELKKMLEDKGFKINHEDDNPFGYFLTAIKTE